MINENKLGPLTLGRTQILKSLAHGKIIDVGCGTGYMFGEQAVNLDRNDMSDMIEYLKKHQSIQYERFKKRYPDEKIPNYVKADATKKIPFNDKEFDCAVVSEVLEHLSLDGAISLLKEAGRVAHFVIISVPNEWEWPKSVSFNKNVVIEADKHQQFYTRELLEDVFTRARLNIVYYVKVNALSISSHIAMGSTEQAIPIFFIPDKGQVLGIVTENMDPEVKSAACSDNLCSLVSYDKLIKLLEISKD